MNLKKLIRTIAIFAVLPFILLSFACASFDEDNAISKVSKTTVIGEELTFKSTEILSSVDNISKIDGIILCKLPNPSIGVLKFGARDLICGEAVTVEGIESLKFIPSSSSLGKTYFSCIPVYSSGKMHKAINISINVLNELNHAPQVENIDIKTARNIAINGVFKGSDPENDELVYSITEQPKLGSVDLCLDAKNKFLYTPYQNKSGKDSFKYIATDKYGNVSKSASVTIDIDNSKLKLTYADMQNNGLHYQSIVLAENGIYQGETIGSQSFLHPNRLVTRSEFISMAMALCEKNELASAVYSTGFADDAAIPAYVKPAVSAAVNSGIINGTIVNGECYLRPQDVIIRSEAAVILNNLLSPDTSQADTAFADSAYIPVWAKQATNNIVTLNIMPQFSDSTIRPSSQLTRQDAIELIYNAMCAIK